MSLADLTRNAVLGALAEFDSLHRDEFLAKYQFARSRRYFVRHNGHFYDSKAIAGVAHGHLPGKSTLAATDFAGGDATVKKALERLGFEVVGTDGPILATPGEVLTNDDIGRRFAVGNMGGMRRSKTLNLLVLISDPFKGLYKDRWECDILNYTGMGKLGNQSLNFAQNKTLAASAETAIPIHLLEALELGKYTYVGEVELAGKPFAEEQLDDNGHPRSAWMFPLKIKPGGKIPMLTADQSRNVDQYLEQNLRRLSPEQLLVAARRAKGPPSRRTNQTVSYDRNLAISEYVKRLADGKCDLCAQPAPFKTKDKRPYLECHHIEWLARGGNDEIENTVALCPNCHRRVHVVDSKTDREHLLLRTRSRSLTYESAEGSERGAGPPIEYGRKLLP